MTILETKDSTITMAAPHITVLSDRCAGCQECSIRCPSEALSFDETTWTVIGNDALCVGCRQCERTCPFTAIRIEGPMLDGERVTVITHHLDNVLGDRSEIRKGIDTWEKALNEASRCLSCPDPTCIRGCPTHNDIPGFIGAIRDGNLDEAHEILRRTTIMPDICSRVCDQAIQCEGSCSWSLAGGTPVAIGALERFICDNAAIPPLKLANSQVINGSQHKGNNAGNGSNADKAPKAPNADRASQPKQDVSTKLAGTLNVAIIGSGPGGAGCAWELAQQGAKVTVFEKDSDPGGLLVWGIPDFTLPSSHPKRLWDQLSEAGVRLELNHEVPLDDLDNFAKNYDAVVVASGAGSPIRLPVAGSDLENIIDASLFLSQTRKVLAGDKIELGFPIESGSTILVVGGGNTAMDTARMARRLGANPICVDWMNEEFAPVRKDELEEARQEGVRIRFCTTVARFEGENGKVTSAVLNKTQQNDRNKLPVVIKGSNEELEVDLVVMAMGYRIPKQITEHFPHVPVKKQIPVLPERQWTASGLLSQKNVEWGRNLDVGSIALGRDLARNLSGIQAQDKVWIVGDALVGPSTVVEAMAHGKQAARSILVHHSAKSSTKSGGTQAQKIKNALVVYDSLGGKTAKVAQTIESRLVGEGLEARCKSISSVSTSDIIWSDTIVLATWVEGMVIANVKVSKKTRQWIDKLSYLGKKPVLLTCTYGVSPKNALEKAAKALEAKGAVVSIVGGIRTSSKNVDTYLAVSKIVTEIDELNRSISS